MNCHYCNNPFERAALRPYGPNGSLVCFSCATLPENEAETNKQCGKCFAAAGPIAVIGEGCDNGPVSLKDAMRGKK
jgi:hypothetical protein